MAVLPMQKISLCVLRKDRKRILEILQRRGVIELIDENWQDTVFEKPDTASARAVLERAIGASKQALEILDHYVKVEKPRLSLLAGRKETTVEFYDAFSVKREKMLQMAYQLVFLEKRMVEDKAKIPDLEMQIEALVPWLSFDISPNFKGTKKTVAFIGTLPPQVKQEELEARFREAKPSIEAVQVEFISTSKDQNCVIIYCIRSETERVEEILRMLEFARPSSQSAKPPANRKKVLAESLDNLHQDIKVLEEEIRAYADHREIFKFMIDYYTMRLEKYVVIERLIHSPHVFFLTGYIPAREALGLDTKLNAEFDLVIEFEEPSAKEDVPVMLSNNGFSSPTESVIESYSMPGKGEVDPTAVTSIFFYILFGLMLSDAAYGVIVSLGCALLLLKFKNMEIGMRKMFRLFFFCGISTIFWGVVFGSYFGDVAAVASKTFFGSNFRLEPLWFNPLNDPMRMLVFCFVVGLIHVYTGLAVNLYQLVRVKKYKDALYDVIFWYALVIGLILVLLSNQMFVEILGLGFTLPSTVGLIAGYIAAIAAIGIIFTGGRESRNPFKRFLKGLYSLYNVTGYLSDVLSYSRLLALGLATSVIASVINQMAGMGGPNPGGVILFIDLEQLLAAKSYKECLQSLHDKGWGSPDGSESSEQILAGEREKTWKLMRELVPEMAVFDVFLYENDYHNLKAAIKLVYSGQKLENVFINNGTIEPQVIFKAIKDHDYELLPPKMREPAREAFQTLLHTGDGQRCDFILDKASLEAVYSAGKGSNNDVMKKVAEIKVATADIKIAVRSCKTGKSLEMITLALANCDSLDIQKLARAATENEEAIYEYLGRTAYAKAVEMLEESLSAFERWCDNMIIAVIRPQKYNPFTIGPLAAYLLARQNEIKAVRMILSGKRNDLPEASIRERLREMYV